LLVGRIVPDPGAIFAGQGSDPRPTAG